MKKKKRLASIELVIAAVLINGPLLSILGAILLQVFGVVNALEVLANQDERLVVATFGTLVLAGSVLACHITIQDATGQFAQQE